MVEFSSQSQMARPRAKHSPQCFRSLAGRADNRCLAGGARGGVEAGNLAARHGEQAVGIVIAHILLQDKGELRDVFERFQVALLTPASLNVFW